jgi:hypothetical protein
MAGSLNLLFISGMPSVHQKYRPAGKDIYPVDLFLQFVY